MPWASSFDSKSLEPSQDALGRARRWIFLFLAVPSKDRLRRSWNARGLSTQPPRKSICNSHASQRRGGGAVWECTPSTSTSHVPIQLLQPGIQQACLITYLLTRPSGHLTHPHGFSLSSSPPPPRHAMLCRSPGRP